MTSVTLLLGDIRALLASPRVAGGPTTTTAVDLSGIAYATPGQSAHTFGCKCSVNPSGMSQAEVKAAQEANMRALGLA